MNEIQFIEQILGIKLKLYQKIFLNDIYTKRN